MAETNSTTTTYRDNPAWQAAAACSDALARAESVLSAIGHYTDPDCKSEATLPARLYTVFVEEASDRETPTSIGNFDMETVRAVENASIVLDSYVSVLSLFDWLDSDKAAESECVLSTLFRNLKKEADDVLSSLYTMMNGGAQA